MKVSSRVMSSPRNLNPLSRGSESRSAGIIVAISACRAFTPDCYQETRREGSLRFEVCGRQVAANAAGRDSAIKCGRRLSAATYVGSVRLNFGVFFLL